MVTTHEIHSKGEYGVKRGRCGRIRERGFDRCLNEGVRGDRTDLERSCKSGRSCVQSLEEVGGQCGFTVMDDVFFQAVYITGEGRSSTCPNLSFGHSMMTAVPDLAFGLVFASQKFASQ